MQKTIFSKIFNKHLFYLIPGFMYFLYILGPLRFWEPFVFSNQIETIVVTSCFSGLLLLLTLPQAYKTSAFRFTKIDLFVIVYGIYLLFRLRYPLEKESFFIAFSITCIYLYFRNLPDHHWASLFFLLPLAGIAQMADGVNRFTMPWHNLSHITGIFNNTGLFGGFAALGLVACLAQLFFTNGGKQYWKFVVVALCITLAVQVYASGSRASWIAMLCAGLFLFFIKSKKIQWKTRLKRRWLQYLPVLCLLFFPIIFSSYLYHLKKDSADGRLFVARVSLEMVKDTPVFGNGISGFRAEYLNHQAGYFLTHPDSRFRMLADDVETPFNEYLKILIEQGIIGLLLFLCVLYCVFEKQSADKTLNPGRIAVLQSAVLFILIFGLFSYPFDKLPFLVLFLFFLASLSRNRNPVFSIAWKKKNGWRIPLLLSVCLVSGRVVWDACRYAQSCRIWNQALAHFTPGREESLSQLKKLYPELQNNPVFLTTYGKALSRSAHYQEAAMVLEKAMKRQPLSFSCIELGKCYEANGFPENALACWEQAGRMVPSRFTPLYLTMKLHFKNEEYDTAQEYAGQLLAKKIKTNTPEINGMRQEALYILNFHPPPE